MCAFALEFDAAEETVLIRAKALVYNDALIGDKKRGAAVVEFVMAGDFEDTVARRNPIEPVRDSVHRIIPSAGG